MNITLKVVMLWVLLALGIVVHSLLETGEALYFSPLPEEPYGDGIPMFAHVLNIVSIIIPMIFALLSLFLTSKGFIWTALIYASVLTLLHIFHVMEDGSFGNISQLLLLTLLPVASVLLVVTLNQWRKEKGGA